MPPTDTGQFSFAAAVDEAVGARKVGILLPDLRPRTLRTKMPSMPLFRRRGDARACFTNSKLRWQQSDWIHPMGFEGQMIHFIPRQMVPPCD